VLRADGLLEVRRSCDLWGYVRRQH
jgi:hypothetical protein